MSAIKTALVTGATSGIGLQLATKLAENGWRILAVGRNPEKLSQLKSNYGTNPETLVADLTDPGQIVQLADQIHKQTDRLDLLANVAGIGVYKSLEELTSDDWQTSINLNLTAPYLLTKELLPILTKTRGSMVLNLGSGMGKMATAGRTAYCASKFGLRGMSLSLAQEYSGGNPDFVLITLGSTLTCFGPKTLEEKQEEALRGKAYFTPDWVADKLIEIIGQKKHQPEYVLYPSEYGMGEWQKPV